MFIGFREVENMTKAIAIYREIGLKNTRININETTVN